MNNEPIVCDLQVSNRVSLEVFGRFGFLTKREAQQLAKELTTAAAKIRYDDPDESLTTFGDNEPLTASEEEQ